MEYVRRLIRIADEARNNSEPSDKARAAAPDYHAQSMALDQLRRIRKGMEVEDNADINFETRAHRGHLQLLIDRALSVPGK